MDNSPPASERKRAESRDHFFKFLDGLNPLNALELFNEYLVTRAAEKFVINDRLSGLKFQRYATHVDTATVRCKKLQ